MTWLTLDKAKMVGSFDSIPERTEIPELINEQLKQVNKTIEELRSNTSSSNEASNVLLSYLR